MKKSDYTANKKVIILTSIGGGGHTSASNALEGYLQDLYDTQTINIFKELLPHLDIFSMITLNRYSGEELYNALIPKKYFRLLSLFYSFGAWYIQLRRKEIRAILRDYFIQTQPALIISVIPIVNNIVLDIAQELDIPFLLIPTDLDATMYLVNINNPTYKKFYLGLAFNDTKIMNIVAKARIPQDQIHIIGAPIRKDFFTKHNRCLLKKEYGLDEDKPTIMILMGARGSNDIEKYVTQLLQIQVPIQLIACVGKNEQSKEQISRMIIPSHITLSVVGFTDHIADYMTISDILITKSGTQSVCEALYENIPLFLDATTVLLPWEQFNHVFTKQHHLGEQITTYDHITSQLSAIISHPKKLSFYKNNLEHLQKNNCYEKLLDLISKIIIKTNSF